MTRSWTVPVLLGLSGAVIATGLRLLGRGTGAAAPVLLWFLVMAVLYSPVIFPRSVSAQEARRLSAVDGRPVVFWRPGCKYCLRLRFRLGREAGRLHWVDIWRDPAGAAAVRAVNNGDETVPTVLVADRPYVNPDPGWLRDRLSEAAGGGGTAPDSAG
ncbi:MULTISPECIES: glutaredoxin domain-containing protein [unclassified Streptomyces]|uniref:glutaredoxin domain-containing protein n=1 Tax=unclassified Streptomyces TaxID=2593676 RepID=UPI003327E8C5